MRWIVGYAYCDRTLAPHHWQSLSDGLPSGFVPLDRRNRLILLLTMRAALTVKELTHLSLENIEVVDLARATFADAAAASELPLFQPESPHWQASEAHPTYSLTVDSERSVRCRTLILDARSSKAMFDWLECRAMRFCRSKHKRRSCRPAFVPVGAHHTRPDPKRCAPP